MFSRTIAISLSPNTQRDDVLLSLRVVFLFWKWKTGDGIRRVEQWFMDTFHTADAVSFVSARCALFSLLQAFEIGKNDEVIIQAFTCVAVADPILWVGARPVYVDVDSSLNIDFSLLENKITKKTRAIIVQHTFGNPANIDMIKKITEKHSLILIEDCSHSLGSTYRGQNVGIFGDAAFFSFGRDKVVSSVFGGVALVNPVHQRVARRLRDYHATLPYPSYSWIAQQLFHPLAFSFLLPLYRYFIGKILLVFFQTLHLLSFPVSPEELVGRMPPGFPARYPNALALLTYNQLLKLNKFVAHRKKIGAYYSKEIDRLARVQRITLSPHACLLRFPILSEHADALLSYMKRRGIILGTWYRHVIDPADVDLSSVHYVSGSCPNAEAASKQSVNLPTYPALSFSQAQQIVRHLTHFFHDIS